MSFYVLSIGRERFIDSNSMKQGCPIEGQPFCVKRSRLGKGGKLPERACHIKFARGGAKRGAPPFLDAFRVGALGWKWPLQKSKRCIGWCTAIWRIFDLLSDRWFRKVFLLDRTYRLFPTFFFRSNSRSGKIFLSLLRSSCSFLPIHSVSFLIFQAPNKFPIFRSSKFSSYPFWILFLCSFLKSFFDPIQKVLSKFSFWKILFKLPKTLFLLNAIWRVSSFR